MMNIVRKMFLAYKMFDKEFANQLFTSVAVCIIDAEFSCDFESMSICQISRVNDDYSDFKLKYEKHQP